MRRVHLILEASQRSEYRDVNIHVLPVGEALHRDQQTHTNHTCYCNGKNGHLKGASTMEYIKESFSRFISADKWEDIDDVQWGVCCCVGAAVSFLIGTTFSTDAKKLMSVIRIDQIEDLSLLFDTASIVLPLIVTVSGKVGSDKPIKFKSSNLQPVILRKTTKNRILKRQVQTEVDSRGNSKEVVSWKEERSDTHTVTNEVPWYLDDGTSRVFVSQAQRASNFLESAGTHVGGYKSKILPVRGTLSHRELDLDLVVEQSVTKKPVLVTGTPLTVVGEAVKDDLGRIRIQKPEKGPFHVSGKNIDKLITDCERGAWFCTLTSLVLASYGIFLIGKQTFHYIIRRFSKKDLQNGVLDAVTDTPGLAEKDAATDAPGPDEKESEAEAGNGLSVTQVIPDLCAICLHQEYNSVIVPCGHMCCCLDCSSQLVACPLCCRRIDQVVKVFRG